MTTPLVTIGITCYNAEDTVRRAVESARSQDWPNLEIVVIDDSSTDRSAAIVEGIAAEDTRIRLIRHEKNLGPGAARQTILDRANGEYLVFFDDDDVSSSERVSVQYRRITGYRTGGGANLVACYASGERLYENGYRLRVDAIGSRPREPVGEEVADYLLFNHRKPGVFYGGGTPSCALMAPVDAMREVGGFDPAFRRVEDADFAVRLALGGGACIGCPELLYTQHATHAPDKSARKNYDAELQLLAKHRSYLESRKRYGFARNWFAVRYHHFNGERLKMSAALARALVHNPVLVTRQLVTTVPARLRHERAIARGADR